MLRAITQPKFKKSELTAALEEVTELLYEEESDILGDALVSFFTFNDPGAFLATDLHYFMSHDRDDLIIYLLAARKFSRLAFVIRELLIDGTITTSPTASATCQAGEMLSRWEKLDPHMEVVGPAVLSCERRRLAGKFDVLAEFRTIDRVLGILSP